MSYKRGENVANGILPFLVQTKRELHLAAILQT